MVSKPKIEIIKKEFGTTDKKLEKLGIIAPTPRVVSTRLLDSEFNKLNKLRYAFYKTKSEILRNCVKKILKNEPEIKEVIKAGRRIDQMIQESDSLNKEEKRIVTFKLDKKTHKKLVKVSNLHEISVSKLIRYFLLLDINPEAMRKGDKEE